MEDITTTSNAYSKDELAAMVRHTIASEVNRILLLESRIQELTIDHDRSYNDIQEETKECVDEMTDIWSLLGPASQIANRLFPERSHLFEMLDKSKSLKDSFKDIIAGKQIGSQMICDKLCCRKQLA